MLPWEAMAVVPDGCRMRRPADVSTRTLPLEVTGALSASLPIAAPAQAKKQGGSLGKSEPCPRRCMTCQERCLFCSLAVWPSLASVVWEGGYQKYKNAPCIPMHAITTAMLI